MSAPRTLTPKEFSARLEADLGVSRSPDWVREQCAAFIRSKGKKGVAVVIACRPYLIPDTELARFHQPLVFTRAVRVA